MENEVSKTFLKVVGYAGCIMLTIFSAMFAFVALCSFISIFNGSIIIGLIGTIGAGIGSWILWSIRKDTLL